MSSLAEIGYSHSLQDFPSISQYFIARILQSDTDFVFSFEQILYLCQTEPENCGQLLAALQTVSGTVRREGCV